MVLPSVFTAVVVSFDGLSGGSIGSTLMDTTFSFLRRKKDDGDNVKELPVLDFDPGLVLVAVIVVVVGDVFLERKLMPVVDAGSPVWDVVVVVLVFVFAVSGAFKWVASVLLDSNGSLSCRKDDRNVCICMYYLCFYSSSNSILSEHGNSPTY